LKDIPFCEETSNCLTEELGQPLLPHPSSCSLPRLRAGRRHADPQRHLLLAGVTGAINVLGVLLAEKARAEVVLQGKLPSERGKLVLRLSNLLSKLPAMLICKEEGAFLHMLLFNFVLVLITDRHIHF